MHHIIMMIKNNAKIFESGSEHGNDSCIVLVLLCDEEIIEKKKEKGVVLDV